MLKPYSEATAEFTLQENSKTIKNVYVTLNDNPSIAAPHVLVVQFEDNLCSS